MNGAIRIVERKFSFPKKIEIILTMPEVNTFTNSITPLPSTIFDTNIKTNYSPCHEEQERNS